MAPVDIRIVKSKIRNDIKEYRKSLSPRDKEEMDRPILRRITSVPEYQEADLLLCYISTPIEVNTRPLVEDAWRREGLQVLPLEEPMRWSEDFGWYLGQVPGVFFGIGAGEACPGLHTPDYSFPDGLLPAALKAEQTALLLE